MIVDRPDVPPPGPLAGDSQEPTQDPAVVLPRAPARLDPLTHAARGFGLLAILGASVALAIGALRTKVDDFLPYVVQNTMGKTGRLYVVANLAGGAVAAVLIGGLLCLWYRRRLGRAGGLNAVEQLSRRMAPLALAAALPLLFHQRIWEGRDLTFMALATAVGLISLALWRMSLAAGPVLPFGLRQKISPLFKFLQAPSLPLVVVILCGLGYAAYFSYYTINAHHNLQTASYDLGIENNLMWNLVHGGPLFKTTPHDAGPQGCHLGYHQTYLSFVLAPFYALAPRPETLLIIQALLIGMAALPLFLLARRRLPPGTAATLAVAYLFYAPVHGANLYDFHYPPFMPFFIWFLLYFVEKGATWKTLLFTLLSISIREDVAGCVGLIGAYMILTGLRPRLGLLIMGMGLLHFVTVKMVVMPLVLKGHSAYIHQYRDLVPKGIGGFGGVLVTVFGNPGYTLHTLMEEKQKLLYILQIMAPLVFLPWRRPVGILLSLPGVFFTLLATHYDPMIQISFQYTFFWTTFLFVAAIRNLHWVQQPQFPGDTKGPIRRASWILAVAGAMLATSYQHGGIMQTRNTVGGFGHVKFGPDPEARVRRNDLYKLIALVPPNAKISSSETIVPHVSSRENAYTLRVGIFDADYVLFNLPIGGNERREVQNALAEGSHGIVKTIGDFALAKRGHDTMMNLDVIRRM